MVGQPGPAVNGRSDARVATADDAPPGPQKPTNSADLSASLQTPEKRRILTSPSEKGYFQREDWTLFRTVTTLGQRAGVSPDKLQRLVLKELADNALDAGARCEVTSSADGWYVVADNGSGIRGSNDEIASLFSIGRPLRSSKLVRMPTRGALGNGLRVVAGAVMASGGDLIVNTRGRSLRLIPQDDDLGDTRAVLLGQWDGKGTEVRIRFGAALQHDPEPMPWARLAILLSEQEDATGYKGRSSPLWYDSDSFRELFRASPARTVKEALSDMEGCAGSLAANLAGKYASRSPSGLSREEAEELLGWVRDRAREVGPKRLGRIGKIEGWAGYCRDSGNYTIPLSRGAVEASIPFVVEVMANVSETPGITVCVNRTPITAEVAIQRDGKDKSCHAVFGCNLTHRFQTAKGKDFNFLVNVQTPYMPITTDGKAPDLGPICGTLLDALSKAAKRARKSGGSPGGQQSLSKKQVILDSIPGAATRASGDSSHRYSQRQLFYQVRPLYLTALGSEPSYDYFCNILSEYEAVIGHDLPGIYRDNRGVLYHPHTGEEIPLGTRNVEKYKRPGWLFNKILYCEKEGFFPILRDAKWPERHDCALLTSKGCASRAARDIIDLLGETGEEITFYCIHDADGPGTIIYQALQDGTRARPSRKVRVVNLGLEPEEALAMNLAVESVKRKNDTTVAVAKYVDPHWRKWLQSRRVELNAMTTPQFLEWLDAKMSGQQINAKVIPPVRVMDEQAEQSIREYLRRVITREVLEKANVDGLVEEEVRLLRATIESRKAKLQDRVKHSLGRFRDRSWRSVVEAAAVEIAEAGKRK